MGSGYAQLDPDQNLPVEVPSQPYNGGSSEVSPGSNAPPGSPGLADPGQTMPQDNGISPGSPGGNARPQPALPPVRNFRLISAAYRLGIGDLINIDVFGAEDYSTQVLVLQDGTINLPRVGPVFVLGQSIQDAETHGGRPIPSVYSQPHGHHCPHYPAASFALPLPER